MVVVQRIIVGVGAVHKVVLVGRLRERDGALASRVAVNIVVSDPHQIIILLYVASLKDRAVVDVVYNGLFR